MSITQTTELGTLYTADEIRAIADHVHGAGMRLHVDGSRIANAAARLGHRCGRSPRDAGVDVLCFGGTKNGLIFGEAVVVLNPEAAAGLDFLRKMNMQLASKMRFVSAQLVALLEGDLWLRSAAHANAMARPAGGRRSGWPASGSPSRSRRTRCSRSLDPRVAERLRAAVPVLRLGRGNRRGPLDVCVRHHRGRRRRIRRRSGRGTRPLTGQSAQSGTTMAASISPLVIGANDST